MFINTDKGLIEMSETEHKAAMTYGTDEYNVVNFPPTTKAASE